MKRIIAFGLIVAAGSTLHAQTIKVTGRISNGSGQPVANAVVSLMQNGMKDTTGSDGTYSIVRSGTSNLSMSGTLTESMRLDRGILEFTVSKTSLLKIEVFNVNGDLQKKVSLPNAQPGVYHLNIANLPRSNQMLIVKASIGAYVRTFRSFRAQDGISEGNFTISNPRTASGMLAKMAAAVDTLTITAAGYSPMKIGLASYDTTVNVTLEPDATTVYKPCPTNGNPCKILPFGDSITEGAASSDGAGYRSQLFALIVAAKQKVTFVGSLSKGPTTVSGTAFPRSHQGHGGWTIDPGISEYGDIYGGISSLVPSPALNDGPHIILLHIGANEFFTKDKATISTRLEALIDKIAQNAPNALIVLAQNTPIGNSNGGHTQAQTDAANAARLAYINKFPSIIQSQVAKGRHIIGVDVSKMPLSSLTNNSMHPNNQGYVYMAGIWYAGIKDLLPK
ncbi:MAG: GDSL-type esterase/lipase family protein [Fibrobacteria bacterium]